jgi:hypothetical protein
MLTAPALSRDLGHSHACPSIVNSYRGSVRLRCGAAYGWIGPGTRTRSLRFIPAAVCE